MSRRRPDLAFVSQFCKIPVEQKPTLTNIISHTTPAGPMSMRHCDDSSELSTLEQSSAAQAMPPPSTLQSSVPPTTSVKQNEPSSLPYNETTDVSMRPPGNPVYFVLSFTIICVSYI